MNVLLNTTSFDNPGGVAYYYRTLHEHFSTEVKCLTIGKRVGSKKGRWNSLIRFFKDYISFFRELKTGNYNLVHLNPSLVCNAILRDAIFLLIAKGFRLKVIVFMHGWDHSCEMVIKRYFLRLFRFTYFRTDTFIVLASDFKKSLIDMGYIKPIYVETTIVANEIFSWSERASISREPNKDVVQPYFNILFLSRIEKAKGIYEVLDSYHILKAQYHNITLTIAGDGAELGKAKEYTLKHRIKDVQFPGYLRNESKHAAFTKSDVYFFPTYYGEGMPISVLEAMAYGLPVVTRPVGGLKDFFENGKMGFITESRDPVTFANLLERLIVDKTLQSKIGAFNCDYAKEHFTAQKVAKRIEEIYQTVMENNLPPQEKT